jgi:hypothetical protein
MPASFLTTTVFAAGFPEGLYSRQLLKKELLTLQLSREDSQLRMLDAFFLADISFMLKMRNTSLQECMVVEQLIWPPRKKATSPRSLSKKEI